MLVPQGSTSNSGGTQASGERRRFGCGERTRHWCGGYLLSLLLHLSLLLLLARVGISSGWFGEIITVVIDTRIAGEESLPAAQFTLVDVPTQKVIPKEVQLQQQHELTRRMIPTLSDSSRRASSELGDWSDLEETLPTGVMGDSARALTGRLAVSRNALALANGGTPGSERAVELGLRWLAEHQRPDGSWSFDHRGEKCSRNCDRPGSKDASFTGATGMALLAFLGAGYTQRDGRYQQQVQRGLDFLLAEQEIGPNGGDLRGDAQPSMYLHGLATLALCEAYAMTGDHRLRRPAQTALDFTVYAQHPTQGGWRYAPQVDGDTSVVGWQVMSLKSGQYAELVVPRTAYSRANSFLDTVQTNRGAEYGYTGPERNRHSTTAIGLLCRMYLGWPRAQPSLQWGIKLLDAKGPDPKNLYYNYYATQAMFHWGGREWERWNKAMRTMLVGTQIGKGHAAGSWDPVCRWGDSGGRLYETCLSVMTLEVYYRFLPLYRKTSIDVPESEL